jgi:hypothetical protein
MATGGTMWRLRNVKLGSNVTVFLLFFGIALLESFRTGQWLRAAFWIAVGLFFLGADNLGRRR